MKWYNIKSKSSVMVSPEDVKSSKQGSEIDYLKSIHLFYGNYWIPNYIFTLLESKADSIWKYSIDKSAKEDWINDRLNEYDSLFIYKNYVEKYSSDPYKIFKFFDSGNKLQVSDWVAQKKLPLPWNHLALHYMLKYSDKLTFYAENHFHLKEYRERLEEENFNNVGKVNAERSLIMSSLLETNKDLSKASLRLGISKSTLDLKIKELSINI